jgi:hypothetical protein
MARRKETNLASGIIANASRKAGVGDAQYVTLSIRPGDKISTLLDLVAKLTSKSPAEHASDGMSESLFLYLVSSEETLEFAANQIRDILIRGEHIQEGCALDLLVRRGVIDIKI